MDKPSTITREAVMAELAEQLPDSDGLRADEFTITQFAEFNGFKREKASNILNELIQAGRCTKRSTVYNSRRCWAYRKVKEEKDGLE